MTKLKPKVVIGGGFNRKGAIVEGSEEIEYERTSLDTVYFDLRIEGYCVLFSKEDAYGEADGVDEITKEDIKLARISGDEDDMQFDASLKKEVTREEFLYGKAKIQENPSKKFSGGYSFSLFGSPNQFTEFSLRIDRRDIDRLTVFGHKGIDDIDVRSEEGFGVEIRLRESRFKELCEYLSKGFCDITLSVSFVGASKFYATWSFMNNEGRTIKYLDSVDDLENPNDLPEHFTTRHPRSMQFSLWMNRRFNCGNEEPRSTDRLVGQ